ncbi:transmembrane protein 180-like isoform X1 [Saccostrea echinata]|uniref:transmembrane protein 180-like isoform X1 n=1 Tax=Saccostrea echinata TaxID=191078 RepID=UPI002A7F5007|nr:transmembrane protein 180-like isoform X1 [Saccostrea echinata]
MISQAFNFYYVNVFLNIYHVKETWFQLAQVLFLIWNAVNDPLFAYCADNKNIRLMSARRNMVLYGAPFFALSFVVPWFQWSSNPTIIGLHLLLSLCFWDTLFTLVGLAYCCLFTEISQDTSKRIVLTRYSTLASLIGSGSVLVLDHASSSLKNFRAFQFVSVLIALLSWALMHYCGRHCHTQFDLKQMKKKNKDIDEVQHQRSREPYIRQTLQILTDVNFISFVITNFFQEFHKTYLISFLAIICDQLIPASYISQGTRSTFYGFVPFSSQIVIILFAPLIAHFSYQRIYRANFIWKICSGMCLYFIVGEHYPGLILLFLLFDDCFTSATNSLLKLPLADITDANMEKYNRNHPISSMVFGTNALITKPANSLSPMLVVAILNRYGYDEVRQIKLGRTGENNLTGSIELKNAMFSLICFYPVVLGVIQLCSWSFYSISNKREIIIKADKIHQGV